MGVVEPKCSGCCLILRLCQALRVCTCMHSLLFLLVWARARAFRLQSWARQAVVVRDAVHATPEVCAFFAPLRVSVCGSVLFRRWPRGTLKRRRPVGKCSKCQLPESDVELNVMVSIQHCCEWREVCLWASHVNASTLHTFALQVFVEWLQLLSAFDCSDVFHGPANRLDVVSAVLVTNEFAKWSHLQHAEDPAKWCEAGRLSASELELLRKVINVGREAPK